MSTNAWKEAYLHTVFSIFITDIPRAKCKSWPLRRFDINHEEFFVLRSSLRTSQRRSGNQLQSDWPSRGGNDMLYLKYRKIMNQGQTREIETSGGGLMITIIIQEYWRTTSRINGTSIIDIIFFLALMDTKESSGIHHNQQLSTFDVWHTFPSPLA